MKYAGQGTRTSKFVAELDLQAEARGKAPKPPADLLDRIADEKLTGRFNVRKDNLCPDCKEYRSVNGTCSCS